MNQRSTLMAVGITAWAFLGMTEAPVRAQSHYFYFKEQRPLALDVDKVAIFRAAGFSLREESETVDVETSGTDPSQPALNVAQFGLNELDVTPSVVPGWFLVGTTEDKKTRAAIESIVRDISDQKIADFVSPVFIDAGGIPVIITPHILVGFDRRIEPARAEAILAQQKAGALIDRDWANMKRTYRLKSASRSGFEVLDDANRLALLPEVLFAEPDLMMEGRYALIPNDPGFNSCWGLHNTAQFGGIPDMDMDAPEAWDISTGSPSIIVVVLDDGVQQDHPDVHQIPGYDATGQATGGGPGSVCDNHGTAVAGCISAAINNNLGTVGVAPNCVVAAARTARPNVPCDGHGMVFSSWVVNSLAWAETIGARVTNFSWTLGSSSAISQKYTDTHAAGIVHFASAANDGIPFVAYPASLPAVNAVAALDPDGTLTWFSSWGTGLAFSAPGINVYTTDRTGNDGYVMGDYVFVQGTSFSSPYAAGVAALALSVNPALNASDVKRVMQGACVDLGDPGYDTMFGHGFVNAEGTILGALELLLEPCELQKLTASDGAANDLFAVSAAISDDVAVVGAPGDDGKGSAYVYRRSGVSWNEEQKLTGFTVDAGDEFAAAVSTAGDVVLVGAHLDDDNGSDSGAAYVFRWNPGAPGSWVQEQKLIPADGTASDQFGIALSVSGDVAVVGAYLDDDSGSDSGSVYVFRWVPGAPGSWVQQQKLLAADGAPGDQFGHSVDISGDVIIVGAPAGDGSSPDSGSAYVFRWTGASWAQEQELLASGGATNDFFGGSTSVSGDVALVGARLDDDSGIDSGSAHVFRWNPGAPGSWGPGQKLVLADGAPGTQFGVSVSVSGETALVGASMDDDAGSESGSAYAFRWNGYYWEQGAKLLSSDGAAGDRFGASVSLFGDAAVVGAYLDDDNGPDSGAAYIFPVGPDCNRNATPDPCDIRDDPALDVNADGLIDACQVCTFVPDPPTPETVPIDKNRYVTFLPTTPADGAQTSLRLTFTSLDGDYSIWNNRTMWISDPTTVTEQSGANEDNPPPTFTAASLSCVQDCRDWGALGQIDVFGEGIVPSSQFSVQAIKCGCDPLDESYYSTPLPLTTSRYGDIVGQFDGGDCSWTPPNGVVGIPFDTVADTDKFSNLPCAPRKASADLVGVPPNRACVDWKISVSDYVATIDAFRGLPYPFTPSDPDPCNALPCTNP